MNDKIHASDEKCVDCGKQAVCFWPVIDPDIESFPYCRPCADKAKLVLMLRLCDLESDGI